MHQLRRSTSPLFSSQNNQPSNGRNSLPALALSWLLGKFAGAFHVWHIVILVLVLTPFAIWLLRMMIDEAAEGLEGLASAMESFWAAMGRMSRAMAAALQSLLPPRWRK